MRNKFLKFLLIFLPLIFALILMLRYVNLPYVGPNATDLNVFSLIARNYNNWGFLNIKFAPITILSKTIPKNPAMYLHHPFFMTFVESLFFKVFGYAFWVGRVSVILPAFLILPLFFLIGKEIKNKKFGIIALFVGSLIPATIVFGRMLHYAGAWTLFFVVATTYFSLKYIKVNRKIFFFLAIICVILGTLSDWPVTYFTPFLIPLMFKNKKRIEGILLVATSTITAAIFLLYSYFMLGSFTNISDAILNRSVGPLLLSLPFWPVRWLIVILIRFVLYFDPLILLFCGIYIYYFVRKLLKKKLDNFDLMVFAFLAFGITHILLYPAGSFGHPFWIYLLVPFVTFSAAQIIEKMLKHKVLLILMVIFAVVFALKIEDWKTQQDLSNLFRYNMAKSVSHYFIPYDTLDVNPGSYIDPDLYVYDFYQNLRFVPSPVKNLKDLKNANFYVYSCIGCNLNNPEVNFLAQKFKYETHISPPGTVYIFFLKQKQTEKIPQAQISKAIGVPAGTVPEKQSLPRRIYTFLMNFLQVPQI